MECFRVAVFAGMLRAVGVGVASVECGMFNGECSPESTAVNHQRVSASFSILHSAFCAQHSVSQHKQAQPATSEPVAPTQRK
jgi:hypothetical protein